VVTHLSLAIAVLVQIGQGTLTPLSAATVIMILDAQNAALAVSFFIGGDASRALGGCDQLQTRPLFCRQWMHVCLSFDDFNAVSMILR